MGIDASTTARMYFFVKSLYEDKSPARDLLKRIANNRRVYDRCIDKLSYFKIRLGNRSEAIEAVELEVDDRNFWLTRWGLNSIINNIQEPELNGRREPEDWNAERAAFAKHFGCALEIQSFWDIEEGGCVVFGPDGEKWLDECVGDENFGKKTLKDLVVHHFMPEDFIIKYDLGQFD